jgi:hypothetical protein
MSWSQSRSATNGWTASKKIVETFSPNFIQVLKEKEMRNIHEKKRQLWQNHYLSS